MNAIHPVILCGGNGTRLWPRSRISCPKPFLPLLGDRTLFQQTLYRVSNRDRFAQPLIVAGEGHAGFIADQAGRQHRLVIEPEAKNTAPAIALAAHLLPRDAVMLVCPSDLHIADEAAFQNCVEAAAMLARQGHLVSFGITPDRPATGYGYIQRGKAIGGGHHVKRFVEKPDINRARQFIEDGGFVWNGGIFVFLVDTFLAELTAHRPDMAAAVETAVSAGSWSGHRFDPHATSFARITGESIDHAVMENTAHAAVVSADMGWSDIGDVNALMEASESDARGNVVRGPAELHNCNRVMADSDGPRISIVGLDDVIVIVDGDEVLVVARDYAQAVGKLDGAAGR